MIASSTSLFSGTTSKKSGKVKHTARLPSKTAVKRPPPAAPSAIKKPHRYRPPLAAKPIGKGLGKGATKGIRIKRHARVIRDNILGIRKTEIKRIARRGGVLRLSSLIYDETR